MLFVPYIATKFLIYKTNLFTSNIQNNKCYVHWLRVWFYKGTIMYTAFPCTVVTRSSKTTVELGYLIKGTE
jgi:hypothetical protein